MTSLHDSSQLGGFASAGLTPVDVPHVLVRAFREAIFDETRILEAFEDAEGFVFAWGFVTEARDKRTVRWDVYPIGALITTRKTGVSVFAVNRMLYQQAMQTWLAYSEEHELPDTLELSDGGVFGAFGWQCSIDQEEDARGMLAAFLEFEVPAILSEVVEGLRA